MRFRFDKEGGYFTPKSIEDLIDLCNKKGIIIKSLYFLSFKGNERGENSYVLGENFYVLDEHRCLIGFSDTDRFPYPDTGRSPVMSETWNESDHKVREAYLMADRLNIPYEAYVKGMILSDPIREAYIQQAAELYNKSSFKVTIDKDGSHSFIYSLQSEIDQAMRLAMNRYNELYEKYFCHKVLTK